MKAFVAAKPRVSMAQVRYRPGYYLKRKALTPMSRLLPMLLISLSLPLLCGCVERTLQIRTEPEGARVFLNGQDKGVTPATIPFDFYGTWDLQIRMEESELRGARSLKPIREKIRLSRPWHQVFPLDFISEVLWPGTIPVEHVLEYTFEEQNLDDLRDSFHEHAREAGVETPLQDSTETPNPGQRR